MKELQTQWTGIIELQYKKSTQRTALVNLQAWFEQWLQSNPEAMRMQSKIQKAQHDLLATEWDQESQMKALKDEMLSKGIKKVEWLWWETVQLNESPWKLVILDETKVSEKYIKVKEVTSFDKALMKKDFKASKEAWKLSMPSWCEIVKDYKLVINI